MATEQQINQMITVTNDFAQAIYNDEIALADAEEARALLVDNIETRRATVLASILNDRFELNNQLKYTNDGQRKSAVTAALAEDVQFQTWETQKRTKDELKANLASRIKLKTNLHKSSLLSLSYYAKSDTAPAFIAPLRDPTNLALTATVSATSSFNSADGRQWGPSLANDGNRQYPNDQWSQGGIWHSGSVVTAAKPEGLTFLLGDQKIIKSITVYTVPDVDLPKPDLDTDPSFTKNGLTAFSAETRNGADGAWTLIPNGNIVDNNKVVIPILGLHENATDVRISAHASSDGYARIAEVEIMGY